MGDERSASRTAVMVAAYRARATEHGLCDDPFAAALSGEEGLAAAAVYDQAFPDAELWIALRTRVLDGQVRARIEDGVRQIVLLGAGLDMRAKRLAQEGVDGGLDEVVRDPFPDEEGRGRGVEAGGLEALEEILTLEIARHVHRVVAGPSRGSPASRIPAR